MGKKSAQKKKSSIQPAVTAAQPRAAEASPLQRPQRTLTSLGGGYARPASPEQQHEVITLAEQERFVRGDVVRSLLLFSVLVLIVAGITVFDRTSPRIGQWGNRLAKVVGLQN